MYFLQVVYWSLEQLIYLDPLTEIDAVNQYVIKMTNRYSKLERTIMMLGVTAPMVSTVVLEH